MLGIVSDLLVLEEVDPDGIPFRCAPVDLAALVQDAIEALLPSARAGGLVLQAECNGPAAVDGDEHRLRQVLDNLVGNAIKYTPPGGRVAVAVTGDERDGTTLTVTDTGIGIPDEERVRLFERFYRTTTARAAGIPGTGLGLALVRRIVERHGGRVTADPGPGGSGTVFTVRLPAPGTQAGVQPD
jgi:signal transduction histidine kinase